MFILLLKQTDIVSSCIIIHSERIMTTLFVRFRDLYRGRRPGSEIPINEQALATDLSQLASHSFSSQISFYSSLKQIRLFFNSFSECHNFEICIQRIFGLVPSYILKSNSIHFGVRCSPQFRVYFFQNNRHNMTAV